MKTIECLKCGQEIIMNNTDIPTLISHDCEGEMKRISEYRIIEE